MSITLPEPAIKHPSPHIAVIGAGIGGLATALRLAHTGAKVTVFERHAAPGGKMRTVPSDAGPVDAGPTVLTMKPVFDALFTDVGARLEDHVTLRPEPLLARHFWRDGTTLDLMADHRESVANVGTAFGSRAADQFNAFCTRAQTLYDAFDAPMMQTPSPRVLSLATRVMRQPALLAAMAPHKSLSGLLARQFDNPKLAQLFARYATYVGGLPDACPAILSLIWQAERRGVWHVQGGMHKLADAIAKLAQAKGAVFQYDAHVTRIEMADGRPAALHTETGRTPVDAVVFNGDPRALATGMLGADAQNAVPHTAVAPRSLSAHVLSFAATPTGDVPLAAHNVFFADDPAQEYAPLHAGRLQTDPTLYVCAQDRFGGARPDGPERFEIILNAPPADTDTPLPRKETDRCQTLILNRLEHFGLELAPRPGPHLMTGPQGFAAMFPASNGSLYGRSPAGMMAAFSRPTARTQIRGLYLTGGGAHPGAGVPMATLSAAHAVAAMRRDLHLTSTCPPEATHGGMSTA